MDDLLNLSAELCEVEFEPGDIVVQEGVQSGAIWVLVSGALSIRKGDVALNTVSRPGAVIGEMSVLLDVPHSVTVEATERSRLRHAPDGEGFLLANRAVMRLVAVGLADRLNFVTTYLADLKDQYGDAPGLAMVPKVLQRLAAHQPPEARTGSARDPDPEY
jgi:CRP/FNR family cyclic AMP-dependent transcriptional regulator